MNANGARFHLLLGQGDWQRCLGGDGASLLPLSTWWSPGSGVVPERPATLPAWDGTRHECTLQPVPIELPRTEGEGLFTQATRRAAAADRHGNVYHVADDRASLRVTSMGSGQETVFWPGEPADCAPERARARLDFADAEVPPAPTATRYLALAVTDNDYLVVAFARTDLQGLLCFDLVAGGPPVETLWPPSRAFGGGAVVADLADADLQLDMCPRQGGGVWLLDCANQRLWELDASLALVSSAPAAPPAEPPEEADFQPLHGPQRVLAPPDSPTGLDLRSAPVDAQQVIAIEPFGDHSLLLLDRDDSTRLHRVLRLCRKGAQWQADASAWLPHSGSASASPSLAALAHDMVYASAARFGEAATQRLFIATSIGNQVQAYGVQASDGSLVLVPSAELYPLRRFSGRALLAVKGDARYDSGLEQPLWTRVVQQPRERYAPSAVLVTPVFDSRELSTTWDKLLLDACIPPDTTITVESRAGDDCSAPGAGSAPPGALAQVFGSWQPEPAPHWRSTGSELPWLRQEAARTPRRAAGAGTWELLLQNAQGRYLQLRLHLGSRNGSGTPRVRALRVWAPRFSYTQRFLPAVYRQDAVHSAFLERWLANIESTLTQIEDRVVNVQTLFDAQSAPAEALPWLAAWFDLALDPAWDERRHRLLVQHAMDFFRWRGTVHGLRLALELAFNPCMQAQMFDGPRAQDAGPGSIRIAEAYQSRLFETLASSTLVPQGFGILRPAQRSARWTPEEGNAGLVERYAQDQGREASATEQLTPFALVPPVAENAALRWRDFCTRTLGFVPAVGAAERTRWQQFARARYGHAVDALNAAHDSALKAFEDLALPADWPANAQAQADWQTFCTRCASPRERGLWLDFLARRYRRIERLNSAHRCAWPAFEMVPLPDVLPHTPEAQTDWLQFERQLLAMHRTAHRFSVLLPLDTVNADAAQQQMWLGLARRIVALEKPAHTCFDVRFYWAFNRVGEARLGLDTQLGAGSRATELIPDAVVGRAYLGASFVGGPPRQDGRERLSLAC